MNKYQRALDNLIINACEACSELKNPVNSTCKNNNKSYCGNIWAKRFLKELVDKKTPMKIKNLGHYKQNDGARWSYGDCPVCKASDLTPIDKFCYNCSQALDWSEENE